MKRGIQTVARWLSVLATLLATGSAWGAGSGAPAAPSAATVPELAFKQTRLPNGMRVVVSVDRSAPTLAACLVLPVGSRDEVPGALGMASLEQKVALEGARGDDVSDLVRQHGGQESSTVGMDATSYCVVLPSNEGSLAMRVLGARMNASPPTPESFDRLSLRVQQQAQNELVEDPYRAGKVRLQQLAYRGYAPYEHAPVASASLIDRTSAVRARDFYVQHHVCRGAAVVFVGDIEPDPILRLARARLGSMKAFGAVSRGAHDSEVTLPRRTSERFSTLQSPKARATELLFGWVASLPDIRQRAAFDLAAAVLGLGSGSRLERRLVAKGPWATEVEARTQHLHGPELLLLRVAVKHRADPVQIAKLIEAEASTLANAGPCGSELERARAELTADLRRQLSSNVVRARLLGEYEAVWGDAGSLADRLAAYAAVTPAEVRDVVRAYLRPWQQTLVEVGPKSAVTKVVSAPLKKFHIVRLNENLTRIAKLYGVTVSELSALNAVGRKGAIFPGQKLVIPRGAPGAKPPRSHTVKKGDSLIGIAKRYRVKVRDIMQANGLRKNKPIQPGQRLVIPPAPPAQRSAP